MVPIASLTQLPYSLSFGDSVYAKVVASNVKGSSSESAGGNGATIITKPDAPIELSEDILYRTESTLGLTWTPGAQNGGSTVFEYRISYALQG